MIGPFPSIDERRTEELYRELVAVADALLPNWNKARDDDAYATALLQIAARLGEHVTTRLERTPQRDAMSFYDLLDIPVQPPHPATAPVVIQLDENRERSVLADARAQIGAATSSDEIIFETQDALAITPARLEFMAAVDAAEDRISSTPNGFLLLEPRETNLPDYRAASFASSGSLLIQIEPAIDIVEGDQLRIGGVTYRVAAENEGLYELVDPLEADVTEGQNIDKLQDFLPFDTRNLQRHEVFIGHEDFFNLEEISTITLKFDPASVANALASGVSWSMYGILDGGEEPGWESLTVVPAGAGLVVLKKGWRGKVEPFEIGGQSSRWLRTSYDDSIPAEIVPGTRTQRIRFKVATATEDRKDAAEEALRAACVVVKETPRFAIIAAGSDDSPQAVGGEADRVLQEGSRTIDQAFHNGSPLPLTSRFFPFGPEPQRFDTFSIAAPEAFSKPGATVTLDITTTDASILAMQVTVGTDSPRRAYGIAHNGALQLLIFDGTDVRWRELDRPEISNLADAGGATAADLELTPALHPQSIQHAKNGNIITDVIFARDRRGQLWARQVEIDTSNTDDLGLDEPWTEVPAPPGDQVIADLVVARRDIGDKSVLFSISGDKLYFIDVDRLRTSRDAWVEVTAAGTTEPSLGVNSRLVARQSKDWPAAPSTSGNVQLVAIDHVDEPGAGDGQAIWTASVAVDLAAFTATATWSELYRPDPAEPRIDATIKPAATVNTEDKLSVFAARQVQPKSVLPFVVHDGTPIFDAHSADGPVRLHPGSAFHAHPRGVGDQPLGVIQGVDSSGPVLALWSSLGERDVIATPAGLARSDLPSVFPVDVKGAPTLVVNGGVEQLYLYTLPEPVINPWLHHVLVLNATLAGTTFVEPANSEPVSKIFPVGGLVINGSEKIYDVNAVDIANGGITAEAGDWKIWGPASATETGTVDDAAAGKFRLKDGDSASVGDFLLVDGRPYTVENVTGSATKTVTLSGSLQPLADGDSADYDKTVNVDTVTVDLLTLMSFERLPDATETPMRFEFDTASGADPSEQTNFDIDSAFNLTWVRFRSGWTTSPTTPFSVTAYTTTSGAWTSMTFPRGYQNPELAWEYLRGDQWRRIEDADFIDTTENLARSGKVSFDVPCDLEPGEVAGQEDYWIRARLVGGDYGRPEYRVVTTIDPNDPNVQTQAITIDTGNLRPPEIIRIDASFAIDEFIDAEQLLVRNNLDLRNQTQANREPDAQFDLFVGAARLNRRDVQEISAPAQDAEAAVPEDCAVTRDDDFVVCTKPEPARRRCEDTGDPCADAATGIEALANVPTRAIYFGFNRAFDVGRLSFFIDAADQPGHVELEFDVLTRRGWRRASSKDETHGFYRRGYVTVGVDFEPGQTAQLGGSRYWLRAVPTTGAEAWSPEIRQAYVNAVNTAEARSIVQEIVGSSTGEQGQRFTLANQPVLPDKLQLRVREPLNEEEIDELNRAAELRGDVLKPVEQYDERSIDGYWVLWQRVDSFAGYGAESRVYKLDPVKGEVLFGERTKAPPGGPNSIRAVSYQSGGGTIGNVPAFAIAAMKSPIEAVETVANPVPASGGSDQPGLDAQIGGAPARLQRAGEALMPPDIEAVCVSFSPDVVRASCLRPDSSGGPIRVAVAARSGERCPQLTRALQDGLRARIRDSAWGALDEEDISVETPDYVRVTVRVRLLPTDASQAAALEQRATDALRALTHPVDGGPTGTGWPFGRPIWKSDVLRTLAPLPGFDRVIELRLEALDADVDLDALGPMQLVCAEDEDIVVRVAPEEEGQ